MCKVPSYVARQRGTSRRQVGSDGRLGTVGARGNREREAGAEAEAGGVSLTGTNPGFEKNKYWGFFSTL